MNELGWGRSTVVCGYLVLGVVCSYPVVNNELGRGRSAIVCGYLVVVDGPGWKWNTVVHSYPAGNGLGQGRRTVVCSYLVVIDGPGLS